MSDRGVAAVRGSQGGAWETGQPRPAAASGPAVPASSADPAGRFDPALGGLSADMPDGSGGDAGGGNRQPASTPAPLPATLAATTLFLAQSLGQDLPMAPPSGRQVAGAYDSSAAAGAPVAAPFDVIMPSSGSSVNLSV